MLDNQSEQYASLSFLQGGGEMGKLIRSFDWQKSPLGTPESWPSALKYTVNMMLTTAFPVLVCWGTNYIQLYNDAFRPINGEIKHPQAMGGSARDTYAEIWDQIGPMFAGVMEGGTVGFPDFMVPLERNGYAEECYFDFSYSPIKDEQGNVGGILVICMETTEKINAIKALEVQQQNLRNIVTQAPVGMCIVKGHPLMVEEVNNLFLEIIGKEREVFKSVPYWEVISEAAPIYEPITNWVMATGETYHANEHEILLVRKGQPETVFVDFVYEPIKDAHGKPVAIMIVAIEVSEKVESRKKIEETADRIQSINEEMIVSNEELAAANEELATTNEELAVAYDELVASEERFRNLIRQAPFAICVIRAYDLRVLEVNDGYLELVGRKREQIEGYTIWDVIAEAAKSYAPVMQEVVNSGKPFIAKEHELILVRNGNAENVFLDFVYEPVLDTNGQVISIMVVATDVTDKVSARRSIEDVEERIRLAIEAAEIGTFDFDYENESLVYSERFAQIFGIPLGAKREELIARYHPDDTNLSDMAHEQAKTTGKIFYEARLVHADGSINWVRVQGNVYFDEHGTRKRTLGTILDITEYRRLQQQKDDFISIASHELKTPITSLKASLQLLERMKAHPTPKLPMLIEQSTKSMEKISELVEDLLNVSKMSQGHVMLDKKPFVVAEMLDACCNHIRQDGKYELIFEGDRELSIFADEHRIEQVIVNFVNNAVKYAPDSRKIFLSAVKKEDRARISVSDSGPGIPADKLPHLFDRYFRADESGVQVSGLGLGLYICAEIVERHGGNIGVESVEGKGSTFWFDLPINQ